MMQRLDVPVFFAFACCVALAGLSKEAAVPQPWRNVIGMVLVVACVGLGTAIAAELRRRVGGVRRFKRHK
jgi:hypothetical protein